jgi:Na+-driven multidrug efflux pump
VQNVKKQNYFCQSNYDDLPFSIRFCDFRIFFSRELLLFYGAKGDIMAPATIFLSPVIVSVPFLALSMMGNTIIRAEGQATFAMVSMMIIPALVNIALDFVFIKLLDLGLYGAALATAFPIYVFSFILWYFIYKTELKLQAKDFKFHLPIIKEITFSLVSFLDKV